VSLGLKKVHPSDDLIIRTTFALIMHAHVNTAANAITRRPQTHTAMDYRAHTLRMRNLAKPFGLVGLFTHKNEAPNETGMLSSSLMLIWLCNMAEVQRNFISFPPSNGNGSRDNRRRVIDSLDEVRGYRLEVQQSPVIIPL